MTFLHYKDAGSKRTQGKRKVEDVVDLESDDTVDIEVDDRVWLLTHNSPNHQEDSSAGYDMDCMDASKRAEPSLVDLDANVPTKGDY